MKKLTVIFIMICILLLAGCNHHVEISIPEDVSEVIVAPYGSKDMTFKYTDAQKVKVFTEYIQSLTLSETKENPDEYDGMSYTIKMVSSNGDTMEYQHYGNLFFKQSNGVWCDMSYKQASEFEELLKENDPDVPAEKSLFQ